MAVDHPKAEDRLLLLRYYCRRSNLSGEEIEKLSLQLTDGMSGADIENICREATMSKLRNIICK